MPEKRYQADLHVHSLDSNRPSMWALRRFNCPESFSAPAAASFRLGGHLGKHALHVFTVLPHSGEDAWERGDIAPFREVGDADSIEQSPVREQQKQDFGMPPGCLP